MTDRTQSLMRAFKSILKIIKEENNILLRDKQEDIEKFVSQLQDGTISEKHFEDDELAFYGVRWNDSTKRYEAAPNMPHWLKEEQEWLDHGVDEFVTSLDETEEEQEIASALASGDTERANALAREGRTGD